MEIKAELSIYDSHSAAIKNQDPLDRVLTSDEKTEFIEYCKFQISHIKSIRFINIESDKISMVISVPSYIFGSTMYEKFSNVEYYFTTIIYEDQDAEVPRAGNVYIRFKNLTM